MVVSSQPLTSFGPLHSKPQLPQPKLADSIMSQSHSADDVIRCEFCDRECKGSRGLKLHQNKCPWKKSRDGQRSSQLLTSGAPSASLPSSVNKNESERDPVETAVSVQQVVHQEENVSEDIGSEVNKAYEEIVRWRKNIFDLPKGHAGKKFVAKMNKLVLSWTNKSAKRSYALKALMIMPAILLQRTSKKTKSSDNKKTLERRLQLWENDKIGELLNECRTLQNRLPESQSGLANDELTKRFTNLMLQGNVRQAVRLLERDASNGVLPLNQSTLNDLRQKHPEGQQINEEMILQGPVENVSSVIFDEITSDSILKATIKTKGSAGPSMYDADDWRNILGSTLLWFRCRRPPEKLDPV